MLTDSVSIRLLPALYAFVMLGTSILSLQTLALSLLYLRFRADVEPEPPEPNPWPAVTVQLPIFNERFVVEALIDRVCALDYPRDALTIQVLDDSTDETTALARERVAHHRGRGVRIELIYREDRSGYKGGALARGLETAPGEFVAVLDADFLPPVDFLRRLVPHLAADPSLAAVQARWEHANQAFNLVTRGQALSLDTHFVVIQTARSRAGLLFNFNGSAGIWRRAAIDDAGGWNGGSLTEDLDLSYRAQLKGWKMKYLPHVLVPAQVPTLISAYRRQQFRWARGGIQALMELGRPILESSLNAWQKLAAILHLSSYLAHPLLLFFLLLCLPLMLVPDLELPALSWLIPASFGPPLLVLLSQWRVYADWKRRYLFFPIQIFLSLGMSLNNTLAVLSAVFRRPAAFARTPKISSPQRPDPAQHIAYAIRANGILIGEICLAAYTAWLAVLGQVNHPELAPGLWLITAGFSFMGAAGLFEKARLRRAAGAGAARLSGERRSA